MFIVNVNDIRRSDQIPFAMNRPRQWIIQNFKECRLPSHLESKTSLYETRPGCGRKHRNIIASPS